VAATPAGSLPPPMARPAKVERRRQEALHGGDAPCERRKRRAHDVPEVAQLVNVTPGTLKITTEQSKRRGGASAAIWWRELGGRACSVLSGRRSGYDASLVQLVAQPRAGAGDCECSSKETSPSGRPGGG